MGTARGSLSTAGGYENRRGAWVIGENLEEGREDFKVFGVFQDFLTLAINVAFFDFEIDLDRGNSACF